MGGTISVQSELGKGSTFAFRVALPLAGGTDDQRTVASLSETMCAPTLAGKRILVVDDKPTNRRVLQLLLESWDCRATAASSGAEALEALRNAVVVGEPIDFLLLDVQMPGMDGVQVARAIAGNAGVWNSENRIT
jgi:PleD family two-component response regulator